MSNLLDITRIGKTKKGKNGALMAMECEVSPDTAPYLVTTSKGLIWVGHASSEGTITAAVRIKAHPDQFFLDVVEAVHSAGIKLEWGNVHPMSKEGLQRAIDHVEEYEVGDVEILVPKNAGADTPGLTLAKELGYPHRPSSWLPSDIAVVVPKERGFVGLVYRVGNHDIVGLVHNAARAISVVSSRVSPVDDVAE